MPELQWDERDFLECLETVPDGKEYGVSYSYDLTRAGHRLLVTVWPFESIVQLTLWSEKMETPLIEFSLFVRGAVRHVNYRRGEYLEFQDSIVAPDRFWHMKAGDMFNQDRFACGVTLQLSIKPSIRLRFA